MNAKLVLLLKILFSAILLIYIFNIIPLEKLIVSIRSANYLMIFSSLLLMIPVVGLSAYQTTILMKAQNSSMQIMEVTKIYLATSFYSFFLPGSLSGGAVKWYKFSKSMSKSSAAAIIVFNRFLELFVVIILGLFYSILSLDYTQNRIMMITFILIFSVFCIGYIVFVSSSTMNKIKKVLEKKTSTSIVINKIVKLLDAIIKFQELKIRDHLKIISIMISYHLISLISFYLLAIALDISIQIWVLGWIGTVITLLSLFPITISGLGIREGSLVYLLGFYGVAPYNAVALSLLAFLRIIVVATVGGAIEFKDFIYKSNEKI